MASASTNTIGRGDFTPAVANAGAVLAMTDDELNEFISVAQARLVRLLCRAEPPADDDPDFAAWKNLLANFASAMFTVNASGVQNVARKQIRNFTVEYGNQGAVNFSAFKVNHADELQLFDECASRVDASRPAWTDDDFPDGYKPGELFPDAPTGMRGWL